MTDFAPIRYVRSHWAGQQGFGWSFWVNLVALRLVLSLGQGWLTSGPAVDVSAYRMPLFTLGLLAHGGVLIWQVGGVLRSSEVHIKSMGSMSNSWGANLGVLVAFWLALSDIWGVWIITLPIPVEENFAARMDREHASRYDLRVNGQMIVFDGEIALGSTKAVGAILIEDPNIEILELNSPGGNIYEARGLAKLARSHGLTTQVSGVCTSSCTVAFIGGADRRLLENGRLGFHQYRVSADYEVPLADPLGEQARDLELFREAGVVDWFQERMYQAVAGDMWFPARSELIRAGVILGP